MISGKLIMRLNLLCIHFTPLNSHYLGRGEDFKLCIVFIFRMSKCAVPLNLQQEQRKKIFTGQQITVDEQFP